MEKRGKAAETLRPAGADTSSCPEPSLDDGVAAEVLAHLADGVLVLNASGELQAVNPAARRILKLDEESSWMDASELQRRLGCNPVAMLRQAGHSLRAEIWVDAVPYQAELAYCPLAAGRFGCVIALRNIVEERRLDQARSEQLSVASHELRTPLTAIKNALDLLMGARVGQPTQRQAHFLELARRNVHHLMEMLNELLDSARAQAGKTHLQCEPLDLGGLVRLTSDSLSPQAEAKDISLTVSIAENLPAVFANASALERALANIVGNAIKFTPRNGAVQIEADATTSPETSRQSVEVRILDNGPGIPNDELDTIFDRFHRVGGSRQVEGTGLGLSIARELVEAHHGSIWAESAPGTGSRFILRIPVLSGDQFFLEQLERDIARARSVPIPLTIVLIRLDNAETLSDSLDEAPYQELLQSVATLASNTTYRSSDRVEVVKEHAHVVGILLDTPRAGGHVFARRVIQALDAEPGLSRAEFSRACATFPDDAVTGEKLYQTAVDALEAATE